MAAGGKVGRLHEQPCCFSKLEALTPNPEAELGVEREQGGQEARGSDLSDWSTDQTIRPSDCLISEST